MPQLSLIKEKGIARINGMDSDYISNLLATKHEDDVFVPECKNGETWGARDLLKLDAWVLRRTYSPLSIIGYEIKCSRSDFEQDQKWTSYLKLCHYFYFVCPAGLIRATDLPSTVGLLWVSTTGKLHTKHKAERQEPDKDSLNRLLIYVMMARSKIVANMYDRNRQPESSRTEHLKEAVERAKERKELAYFVKGHIREYIDSVNQKDRDLQSREVTIKRFEDKLATLGIIWDSQVNHWQDNLRVENEIDLLKKRIDRRTLEMLKNAGKQLVEVAEIIEKYHAKE